MLAFYMDSVPSAKGKVQDYWLEIHEKQKHSVIGSKNSAEHPHSRAKIKAF